MMEDSINFNKKDRNYFIKLFNIFGKEKFLYGTNYPVQTYKQTNKLLTKLSKYDKIDIKYNNIRKLFNV
jgi:predicted TIM-barrel fold metal-dependent hydrolase